MTHTRIKPGEIIESEEIAPGVVVDFDNKGEAVAVETNAQPQPDNLRDTILELAGKDREATLHNVYAALEELGAIRMLTAAIAYDPRIIGAHREARQKIIGAMGEALESAQVIGMRQFTQITGAAELHAVLAVVLPADAAVPEPAEHVGQEVTN